MADRARSATSVISFRRLTARRHVFIRAVASYSEGRPWPGSCSRACSVRRGGRRTPRVCCSRFRSACRSNVGFGARARRRSSSSFESAAARHRGHAHARRAHRLRHRPGIARKRSAPALFWADTGDRRVEFLHSFILLVLPYLGLVLGGASRRMARAGAPRQPVPRRRPAAALQDSRHQRHHRRPHRRRLRDRLHRRHARHPAVRAEGAAAGRRFRRLAEAQPRPPRPRHPAEDSEDGRRRGDRSRTSTFPTSAKSI